MIRNFNDKQGNRDRACKSCLVFEGEAFTLKEGEERKLATVRQLSYKKDGKWSNATFQVTTNSAKLVVVMSPFEGWTDDVNQNVTHILSIYENGESGVTEKDAEIAFRFLYPKTAARIDTLLAAEKELL